MEEVQPVDGIFRDARSLYHYAQEELQRGKLRDAAEKAWGATKRATDVLILARTGREPGTAGPTLQMLRTLRGRDPAVRALEGRYTTRGYARHGA